MFHDPYKEIRQREYNRKIHNHVERFEKSTLPKREKKRFLFKNGMVIEEVLTPIMYDGRLVEPYEIRGLSSIFLIISTNDPLPGDEPFLLVRRLIKPISSDDYPYCGVYGPEYEVIKELDIEESENQ